MSRGWSTAHLTDIPRAGSRRTPVRTHFGIRAFGINAFTADVEGGRVIPEHDETPRGHEEVYLVTDGHATFVVDGDEVDAPAGTFLFISDPGLLRTAFARDAPTTVLAVGAAAGRPFEPSAWELWATEAQPACERGDYEGAIEISERLLADHPDEAILLFNLACCESRVGRRDDALAHLARALELRPMWRYKAREESDLDSIRDDPRFPA